MKKMKTKMPLSIVILLTLTGLLVIASMLVPYVYPIDLGETHLTERLAEPSIFGLSESGHLLGCDYLGRDLAIRLLYATRTTIMLAFVGLGLAALLGISLGVLAGMFGGILDDVVMFMVNVRHALPAVLIGIIAATIFGKLVINEVARVPISFAPATMIFGMVVFAHSATLGPVRLFAVFAIEVVRFFSKVVRSLTSIGSPSFRNVAIALGRDLMILPSIGIKFLKMKLLVAFMSFLSESLTPSPSARLPMKFCAAAFIALNEPLNVSDASSAATPVRPRSPWITWIAS